MIGHQGRSGHGAEKLAPTGIRSPDRPACSQSLYRLSYPTHSYVGHSTKYVGHSTKYVGHSAKYVGHSAKYVGHSTKYVGHSTKYVGHSTKCLSSLSLKAVAVFSKSTTSMTVSKQLRSYRRQRTFCMCSTNEWV